jgi:hypothetical protein
MAQQDTSMRKIKVNYKVVEVSGMSDGNEYQFFTPMADVSFGTCNREDMFDDGWPEGFRPITDAQDRILGRKTFDEAVSICKKHKGEFYSTGNYRHEQRVFDINL